MQEKNSVFYNFLPLLMENSPDLLWAKDLEKKFIFANKKTCELLFNITDPNEIIGITEFDFSERERAKHPDQKYWYTFGEACVDSDAIVIKEKRAMRFDEAGNVMGRFLFLDVHKAPIFDDNGNIIGTIGSARDVTQVKQLEEERLKNEKDTQVSFKQISILVESLLQGILYEDENREIIFSNQAFCGFLGIPAPSIITGKNCSETEEISKILFADPENFIETIQKRLKDKRIHLADILFTKDGRVLERDYVPVYIQDEPKGSYWIYRDITNSKKNEDSLHESEKKYRALLENMNEVVVMVDLDDRIQFVNKKFTEKLGYTLDEVLGKVGYEILAVPEQRDIIIKANNERTKNQSGQYEITHRSRDGKSIDFLVSGAPLVDADGNVYGSIATMTDITERKRTEMIQHIQYNIAYKMAAANSLNDLFNTVREELNRLINSKNFFIANYDEKTKMLSASLGEDEKEFVTHWSAEKSLTGLVIKQRKSLLFNKEDIRKFALEGSITLVGARAESWLGVPMLNRDKIIGAIVVQSYDDPNAYDENSIKLLEIIANQLSVYIEQKRAVGEALYLSKAIEQSPVSIVITDPKGIIEYVNPKFSKISGFDSAETVGRSSNIQQSGEHTKEFYRELWNTIIDGKDWHGEFHNKKKNGELFWENTIISPIINEEGKIIYFVAVKEDITDRKRTELELKERGISYFDLFNTVQQAIYIQNPDMTFINVNQGAIDMYGYKREEFIGRTPEFLSAPGKNDLNKLTEFADLAFKGYPQKYEFWGLKKNGTVFIKDVWTVKGKYFGKEVIITLAIDISERKKMENDLVKAKEQAEQSTRLKDAFMANISHEIRTPLNGILGMASIIQDTFSSQITMAEEKYFKAITLSSNRITRTIDMILNFSQLQIGTFHIQPKTINLALLLKDQLKQYKIVAAGNSLELVYENSIGTAEIVADEYCITQSITNLVDNALKFTESGIIKIRLYEDEAGLINLDISDTGIGISDYYLQQLFNPYSQEETGYGRSYEGVGLGLSLVKKFLRLNKADISVKSQKGIGSTFTINFNQKKSMPEFKIPTPQKSYKTNYGNLVPTQDRLQILVVEDDAINQLVMKSRLRKNFEVTLASSAETALELLKAVFPDLILMDISLQGGMNGLELTKLLKADFKYSKIPIIAVTGHASNGDRDRILNAGCDDYLSKPFDTNVLLEKIRINTRD